MVKHIIFVGAALGFAVAAAGQTAPAKATPAKPYVVPRLADGHPDLQGTYDLATMTPMERARGTAATMTLEQASKLENASALRKENADQSLKGERKAPPVGGDGSAGPAGNVGGYNAFWLDPGTKFSRINGEIRTSILVDPPDGRVPAMTQSARARNSLLSSRPTSDATESKDPGLEPGGAYDDPERRPLGERCLLGFGSTSGPPALPDYFYNNLHQIVQSKDSVMILTEMVHDVRVVRMNAQHLPKHMRQWLGDSVGHWEGDTLVVDTTNFTDKTRFRGSTMNLHVVERFSRVDANTLLYRFTIDDPETWEKSWTGEYTWPATPEHTYEYACHEANYAMAGIMSGAREREREAATPQKRQ